MFTKNKPNNWKLAFESMTMHENSEWVIKKCGYITVTSFVYVFTKGMMI